MITLILHIANAEPVKVEVEEMPKASDNVVIGHNPRERSDKELSILDEGVVTVIFPWWRINYVQVLPDPSEQADIPTFFRED